MELLDALPVTGRPQRSVRWAITVQALPLVR